MPDLKEPNFFAFSGKPTYFKGPKTEIIWDINEYLRLFEPATEGQLLGEASTVYLNHYEKTIINIKRHIPGWKEIKIIIILRNPVERAFSFYLYHKLLNAEPLEFEDAIEPKVIDERIKNNWNPGYDYIGFGLYYKQTKAYLDTFPHVKVCLFEDLKMDAVGLMRDIFRFLEVEDSFIPSVRVYNPSGIFKSKLFQRFLNTPGLVSRFFPLIKLIPLDKRIEIVEAIKYKVLKKPEMKEETKQYLKNLYRDDILKLQELIGRDLSHWLK